MCTCCDEGKVANVPLAHLPRCCDEGKAGNVLSWLGGQRKWECTQLAQLGPADSASPAQLLCPELGPAAQLAQLAQLGGSAEPAGPSWRHPAGVSWRQPPAGPARAACHQLAQPAGPAGPAPQLAQLAQLAQLPAGSCIADSAGPQLASAGVRAGVSWRELVLAISWPSLSPAGPAGPTGPAGSAGLAGSAGPAAWPQLWLSFNDEVKVANVPLAHFARRANWGMYSAGSEGWPSSSAGPAGSASPASSWPSWPSWR